MKYISFAIPCYNSEAYMEKAINSILVARRGCRDHWLSMMDQRMARRRSLNGTRRSIRPLKKQWKRRTVDMVMQ